MIPKIVTGDCPSCESNFEVEYFEEMVSEDVPQYCPFCGEEIEITVEDYPDTDDLDEDFEEE